MIPSKSPDVNKDGLDILVWFNFELRETYCEAVSADAKDFITERFGHQENNIMGLEISADDFLNLTPNHYCIGVLKDDGEVGKILPSPLH